MATQWRVVPIGPAGVMYVGLDYASARAGLRAAGLKLTPGQWSELQMIEAGALSALNRDRMQ